MKLTGKFPLHFILLVSLLSVSCSFKVPENPGDTVVGLVDEDQITLNELKANYDPALVSDSVKDSDLKDFLPVYLNFKAKLRSAREAGYMQTEAFQKELQTYARESAYGYWLKNVVDKELYDEYSGRSEELLRAKQLLIRLPGDATPSDTQRVYNRLMQAREEYRQGTSFSNLVEQYASVVNNQRQGGNLGYFTAGRMVKPFEDAAYSLKIDSVSMPVRTRFGYHLIVVTERIPRPADRNISHIFFRTRGRDVGVDSALAKAYKVYRKLQEGMPWNKAVQKYSEDTSTKKRGGDIGWINYGQLVESFIDSVYAIETKGVPTKPTLTPYGVHIFRLDSIRTYSSENQRKEELTRQLEQLPRYKNRKDIVHKRVLDSASALLQKGVEQDFIKYIESLPDTTKMQTLTVPTDMGIMVHYVVSDSSYTISDYVSWLKRTFPNQKLYTYKQVWLDDYKEYLARKHIVQESLKRFPGFVLDYNEFRNSLAVFQITQDSVWTYAENDTAKLKSHYNKNTASYKQPAQYLFYKFTSVNDSLLQIAKKKIESGIHADSINTQYTGLYIKLDSVDVNLVGDNFFPYLNYLGSNEYSRIYKENNRYKMYYLKAVKEARTKSFEEALPVIINEIQQQREKKWLAALRKRHAVKAYPERLEKALIIHKNIYK